MLFQGVFQGARMLVDLSIYVTISILNRTRQRSDRAVGPAEINLVPVGISFSSLSPSNDPTSD